jgi:vacuole morphology and inheritance protein 14
MDVLFVLDCTASMTPWIRAAQTQVRTTLASLQAEYPDTNFRVGLIVYRDYGDDVPSRVLDFTTNFHRLESILDEEYAEGGDDDAEDITGALWVSSRLEWASEIRHMFVITDAPAHGSRYHTPRVSDRFPDGDPEGCVLEDEVQRLARANINMTFIRIHARTDQMIDVLQRVYEATFPRTAQFRVEELFPHLPPPMEGLARHTMSVGDAETVSSPDAVLSRAVSRAVTQSLSVYDRSE